jgi:putative oxidoreductase
MTSINYIAAVGRLMIAAIFIVSAITKFLTPTQTQAYIASVNIPQPVVMFWISTSVELIGGVFLALGIGTRFAALVLAAFTIAAAVGFHTNFADQNQFIHFMKNMAISGGLLQVFAFGSGGLAITHRHRP